MGYGPATVRSSSLARRRLTFTGLFVDAIHCGKGGYASTGVREVGNLIRVTSTENPIPPGGNQGKSMVPGRKGDMGVVRKHENSEHYGIIPIHVFSPVGGVFSRKQSPLLGVLRDGCGMYVIHCTDGDVSVLISPMVWAPPPTGGGGAFEYDPIVQMYVQNSKRPLPSVS